MKKLSADVIYKVEAAREALEGAVEKGRAYYDAKSEDWQGEETGTEYGVWLDDLESVIDTLNGLPVEPA